MQKELLKFIVENNLSPFNKSKTQILNGGDSIFKTRDAKSIHNRVLSKISENIPELMSPLKFLRASPPKNILRFGPDLEEYDRYVDENGFPWIVIQKNKVYQFDDKILKMFKKFDDKWLWIRFFNEFHNILLTTQPFWFPSTFMVGSTLISLK